TKALIARGKARYQIFCTHCHGAVGDGEGMIAQRGLTLARPVASYHTDRLRELPDGHIFDVITNGFGTMYPFSDRIPDPNDRWAIVAYIRTLQYSQFAPASSLPADMRAKVDNPPPLPSQQKPAGKHGKGEDHSAGGAH
ncbi:MAG: c-type cytochrome, partial [Armatimonadota bacterium]